MPYFRDVALLKTLINVLQEIIINQRGFATWLQTSFFDNYRCSSGCFRAMLGSSTLKTVHRTVYLDSTYQDNALRDAHSREMYMSQATALSAKSSRAAS